MLRSGQIIALAVLSLLAIGVVMVGSAGMGLSPVGGPGDATGVAPMGLGAMLARVMLSRSALYAGLALLAMGGASLLPMRLIARWASGLGGDRIGPIGLALGVLALLLVLSSVYWPGVGGQINGSHRWIALATPIGALSIQPSEIAKWGLIGLLAWYGAVAARRMERFWSGLAPALAGVGLVAGVVMREDLGTAVLIGAVGAVVLIGAGARARYFLGAAPLAAAAVIAAIVTSEYRMRRWTAFMDPMGDPQGAGYHLIQSIRAVGGGDLFGRGLGLGISKFGYVPEDTTDFLFAIISEETGLAGAIVVVGLYLVILAAALSIVRRESVPMLKLLGLGVMATLGLQAAMNLVVVTGLAPTKGIALPLLSSGGTGWVLTAGSLGLLLAIDRAQAVAERAAAQRIARENERAREIDGARAPARVAATVGQ